MFISYLKLILFFLILLFPLKANATTWYACSGGGNWSASVWTSVSGDEVGCTGSTGTPVAGDTAILNSSSGNITITAAAAAASVTMTGYTGTLGASSAENLTVSGGTVTLATGNTISSNITLVVNGAETLTSAGQTWPGPLTFSSATTTTLSNNGATWTNTGLVTFSAANSLDYTVAGDTLTANGGLTPTNNTGSSGTLATIILGGGTWTGNSKVVFNPITFAGNVTLSGTMDVDGGTITYSSGTITTTGSTLIVLASMTFNTNGMTWNNITLGATYTITLASNLTCSGIFQNPVNPGTTFSGAYNLSVGTFLLPSESGSNTFTFPAGQTLFITSAIKIAGDSTGVLTFTYKSGTTSSPTYINYSGTAANQVISGTTFTDVQATGNTLYNYGGGVLTRTTNITNETAQPFLGFITSTGGLYAK